MVVGYRFWHRNGQFNPTSPLHASLLCFSLYGHNVVWEAPPSGCSLHQAGKPTDSCRSVNACFYPSLFLCLLHCLSQSHFPSLHYISAGRWNRAGLRTPVIWLHTILLSWFIIAHPTQGLYITTCLKMYQCTSRAFPLPVTDKDAWGTRLCHLVGVIPYMTNTPIQEDKNGLGSALGIGETVNTSNWG